jgi:hypothetical protein
LKYSAREVQQRRAGRELEKEKGSTPVLPCLLEL